jgi:hypothetical protein
MMTKIISAFGIVLLAFVTTLPAATAVNRSSLRDLERAADTSFETLLKEDPLSVLGATRAVYLDGYGVVFSTEVDLSPSAAPNPFRPAFGKEDIARLKEKKRLRVNFVKASMQGILFSFAASLSDLPLKENVALAVTIWYYRWEDLKGMPKQILMVAPRQMLLDAKAGNKDALATLKVQEFY